MQVAGHTKAAPVAWTRAVWVCVAMLATALLIGSLVNVAVAVFADHVVGDDLRLYLDRTRDWMATGHFYAPYQLAGPYGTHVLPSPAFYPPTLLYVLVPFALGAPGVLWWAIPLGIIAFALWRARPTRWGWAAVALALLLPRTWTVLLYGNPSMWAMAAVVAGCVWTWPLAFAPLKLVMTPFALLGVRSRRFWIAAAAALALAVPFGSMWLDFGTALLNARNDRGPEYLLGELPIAGLLALAAMSRRISRPGGAPAARR